MAPRAAGGHRRARPALHRGAGPAMREELVDHRRPGSIARCARIRLDRPQQERTLDVQHTNSNGWHSAPRQRGESDSAHRASTHQALGHTGGVAVLAAGTATSRGQYDRVTMSRSSWRRNIPHATGRHVAVVRLRFRLRGRHLRRSLWLNSTNYVSAPSSPTRPHSPFASNQGVRRLGGARSPRGPRVSPPALPAR